LEGAGCWSMQDKPRREIRGCRQTDRQTDRQADRQTDRQERERKREKEERTRPWRTWRPSCRRCPRGRLVVSVFVGVFCVWGDGNEDWGD
jgi:hypothetical protein